MIQLEIWFLNNELILNITQACAMSFHSSHCRHRYKPHVCYNENDISYASELKFVVVNITENLNCLIHICSLCASLSKVYYIIKSLKDVNEFPYDTIYYAYLQSRMKYGIIFWGRDRDSVIFFLQKKVSRLISGVKTHDSCRHIFIEYFILIVASLYILEVLCFIKKFKRNLKHNSHILAIIQEAKLIYTHTKL
jgi:hypothetical protein